MTHFRLMSHPSSAAKIQRHVQPSATFLSPFFILRRIGKNKAKAHYTSTFQFRVVCQSTALRMPPTANYGNRYADRMGQGQIETTALHQYTNQHCYDKI